VKKIRQRNAMGTLVGVADDVVVEQKDEQDCQIVLQILVVWENEGATEQREEKVFRFRQNFPPDRPVLPDYD
jgi:hypothetical protein